MITRRLLVGSAALLAASAARRPARAASFPFKLFDSHAHLFTDDIARYPLAGEGNVAVTTEQIKARVLASPNTLEAMLAWWDAAGVEAGLGVQYRTAYGLDNRYLLDSAEQSKGRVRTMLVVDGEAPQTPEMIRTLTRTRGVAGIRLTGLQVQGGFPWLDSDAARRTWAAADELGLAVGLMYLPPTLPLEAAADALVRIGRLARDYPHARIVLDHLGFPRPVGAPSYGLTAEHLALVPHRNVYFKFTTLGTELLHKGGQSPAAFVRKAVDVYGADRMMWGSDAGNTAGPYASLVEAAVAATSSLNRREQQAMLHDTASRVFAPGGRT